MTKINKTRHCDMRSEILRRRYLWKDKEGKVVETEQQMFRRVAEAMAAVESQYGATTEEVKGMAQKFYEWMATGKFLPNSPTLMNAGRVNGMLSACFVLPVEDSINEIFDAVKNTALIQKAGGGTGFDFTSLRPTGDLVTSSGGKTSGPISFMRVFAEATQAIQQGAFRRGANMGMMSVDHPDILKFIRDKQNSTALTNFNISVKVPDAFMVQLQGNPDLPHEVINPRTQIRYAIPHSVETDTYAIDDLVPIERATVDYFTVGEIWQMIVTNAHATGEPGVCFIDRVNRDNPTPMLGEIKATNPCGEQPLLPYEACNLGSIDVSKFVLPRVRNQLMEGRPPCKIREIPKELSEVLVTAHEVMPEWHVKIQTAFQEHTDNAVSKIVNLPSDATISDVDGVYRLAYQLGSKGITVYRDGCHDNQVITGATTPLPGGLQHTLDLRPRVRTTTGSTTKFRIGVRNPLCHCK